MHCSLGGVEASTILINFNSFFYIVNVYIVILKYKNTVTQPNSNPKYKKQLFYNRKVKIALNLFKRTYKMFIMSLRTY